MLDYQAFGYGCGKNFNKCFHTCRREVACSVSALTPPNSPFPFVLHPQKSHPTPQNPHPNILSQTRNQPIE